MRLQRLASALSAAQPLAVQLGVATIARLVLNTSRRMPYTFAPTFSRALGVPLPAITSLIALNQATSLLGPLSGPLGDQWGYRTMMLGGLGLLSAGMLAVSILPIYTVIASAVALAGVAKILFDPAIQAYTGECVPYQNRGLAIGMIETSWAGSTLLGIPLAGILIDRAGWQSPFVAMGVLALLSGLLIAWLLPSAPLRRHNGRWGATYQSAWQSLRQRPATWGLLSFTLLTCAANDCIFVVYASWLETEFTLTVVALGSATVVIGLAELLAEGLVATVSDRIGLHRAAIAGTALAVLSYIALPLASTTLPLALGGLFLIFLCFEFSIVSAMSLFTEVMPTARGTMMSLNLSAAGAGRTFGALLGGFVWPIGRLSASSIAAAAICALALGCLAWGLHRWRDAERSNPL
ncbi:MAG: MFS transporter [Anaerolineae bacterium]